jgi:hypothetical protein
MYSKKLATLAILVTCSVVVSCAGTRTPDMGSSLWSSLGGVQAVSNLAQSFGKQLAGNASLNRQLGKDGIDQVQRGLYNSIGDAAGYKIDKGSDLQSVLKKQNLDKDSIDAVGKSLQSAAKSEGLGSSQMAMLTGLWEPIAKTLM